MISCEVRISPFVTAKQQPDKEQPDIDKVQTFLLQNSHVFHRNSAFLVLWVRRRKSSQKHQPNYKKPSSEYCDLARVAGLTVLLRCVTTVLTNGPFFCDVHCKNIQYFCQNPQSLLVLD